MSAEDASANSDDAGTNADYGLTFETHLCETIDATHVAHDGDGHENTDAVATRAVRARSLGPAVQNALYYADTVTNGDTIACKAARYRISDGSGSRRGRYWIPQCELEAVDAYAFGVYHQKSGVITDAVTVLPTSDVAKLIGDGWVESPRRDIEYVARPPWSRVFDPQEVIVDGE